LQRLLDVLHSRVDLVIVTNNNHAALLRQRAPRVYVCQDPVPSLPADSLPHPTVGSHSVFLICSFDIDEPYEAAFQAFSSLADLGYTLFVSGNYTKAGVDVAAFPWVRFLGFLSYEDYIRYLRNCAVIMDLTTLEDCLVCGAYEALSVRKPLVLSRTAALSEYFGDAAVLTDNAPAAIRESVQTAYARSDELSKRADDWLRSNEVYMTERIRGLSELLLLLRDGTSTT
jgi:glycosyltransferase involved in cell wall biosynthesis